MGRSLPPTTTAQVEAVFDSPLIWDIASDVGDRIEGRRRRYPLSLHLAYGALSRVYRSANRLDSEIIDGDLWTTIRRLHNERSDQTIQPFAPKLTADSYRYARDYLCSHEVLPTVVDSFTRRSVEIARQVGLLDPDGPGSRTRPDPSRVIYGDGTVVRPMYGPDAGRVDPDAAIHQRHDGSIVGNNLVTFAVRGSEPHLRVVLIAGRVPEPGQEAETAVGLLRTLVPIVGDGALAVVYDGALRGVHHDAILTELGLIVINKVHPAGNVDGQRSWRTVMLGTWDHEPDGSRCVHTLAAHNGAVCETYLDHTGTLVLSNPLERRQIRRLPRSGGHRFSLGVDIPCPKQPFVAWVSPHRQPGDTGYGRPDQVRLIPPDDELFAELYGLRNDSESINGRYKNTLYARRASGLGWRRQLLDLISWAVASNSYAWALHAANTAEVAAAA